MSSDEDQELEWPDWVVIGVYFVAVILVGILVSGYWWTLKLIKNKYQPILINGLVLLRLKIETCFKNLITL